jgi:hypothetical protein
MNTSELMKAIGQVAILSGRRNEFDTSVVITDAKMSYGRILYQVTPVSGTGTVWVDAARIKLERERLVLE